MPKRVIDFDAMWGSDKLASCAAWAQAEYAWLYGLADASGCFELTNLRVIWGRVAAIRQNLTIERLEQIFGEFEDKGLLFAWEHEGKRYGHWTGSDVPGRLPPPSWRMRLERLAPPVPKQQLADYVSKFSRGRAASPGGRFVEGRSQDAFQGAQEKSPRCGELDDGLKGGLEAAQAQDWDLNWNREEKKDGKQHASDAHAGVPAQCQGQTKPHPTPLLGANSNSHPPDETTRQERRTAEPPGNANQPARVAVADAAAAAPAYRRWDKSTELQRELRVGQGPFMGPIKVRPEVLERIRARDAARKASRPP